MATVSEKFASHYRARREMSDLADLARLFVARLFYPADIHLPATVTHLVEARKHRKVEALEHRKLKGLAGSQADVDKFAVWLGDFITLGQRTRGTSCYPLHPLLSCLRNGEESRMDDFIMTLVQSFSSADRQHLHNALWGNLPPFEKAIYDLVQWQIEGAEQTSVAIAEQAKPGMDSSLTPAATAILERAREDLLALATEVNGVQDFTDHAGRLLALALTRFFLAQANVDMTLPIYAAPATDSHEGVRTLAHEAIEVHRARFEQALHRQFAAFFQDAVAENGGATDPSSVTDARALTKRIFHPSANIVSSQYADLHKEYGNLCGVAYYYYWQHSGARSRFLRQLHSAQLNLAKKAGIANSRSQYSSWHYYWLSPSLVETLLLVSRPRLKRDRMLVVELLRDWRERYGLTMLIDDSWQDTYRANFPGLGNPEALNEANQRRFSEILSERGRLHKNSDDFPWVILRD